MRGAVEVANFKGGGGEAVGGEEFNISFKTKFEVVAKIH